MLKQHDRALRTALLLTDISLCALVWGGMAWIAPGSLPTGSPGDSPASALLLAAVATLAIPAALRAVETQRSSRLESLLTIARKLVTSAVIAFGVLATVSFLMTVDIAPTALAAAVMTQLAAVGALRLSVLATLRVLRRHGQNFRNVLIVGTGPRAREVTQTIQQHPEWGLKLVGYVDEGDTPLDESIPPELVHKFVDFPQLVRDEVIDEVITACPRTMLGEISPVVAVCSAIGVPLTVMTDLFGDYLPAPRVRRFASHAALSFAPVHHSRAKLNVKRGIDIAGALVGLALAAPLVGVAALAIRLTSPGPIFFRQVRCGLNGRPFLMLKLRTMVEDAEERRAELEAFNEMEGPVFKMDRDPRITPVGVFLRAYSLDELPQFWNILVGDMSLVGPRPAIPAEVVQYETAERRRLSMRPGLTCLWQVSGRNDIDFDDWVKLDLQYIDTWSLTSDLKILALTVPTVLGGTGL